MRTLRVVQWATGAVGGYALRGVVERPEFELAGVLVYDPDKIGMDAGPLVGLPETGVTCTDDVDAILALDADCVLHMPLPATFFGGDHGHDVDMICKLLASGKNVITTTGFVYPMAYGTGVVDRIEKACREGGTTLHGTGINPGFVSDVLPLTLTGLSSRLDHIYVRETSDYRGHPSHHIVTDLIGFARTPKDYVTAVRPFRAFQRALFTESVQLVSAALGVELDEIEEMDEFELAADDFEIASGLVRQGTVAASRWVFSGLVRGRPFMTVECVYKADADKVPRWAEPGFSIHIEGRPTIVVNLNEVDHGLAGAAAHAVNTIRAVVLADPGIRTILDLPMVTGRGTARLA
ncbi:NAD(P)H-dependent amine dehydrogenase family protein [Herbidospora yilanensis]|uniref:NAD(P)H-dependent amine dehydrogenase family protein n=1 Tax=Herbidospora yilanensis TaxID=354426 RepID=UPI00078543FB|nr:dihydrodipicolinate reductase [Herbidospora yilanensis]